MGLVGQAEGRNQRSCACCAAFGGGVVRRGMRLDDNQASARNSFMEDASDGVVLEDREPGMSCLVSVVGGKGRTVDVSW